MIKPIGMTLLSVLLFNNSYADEEAKAELDNINKQIIQQCNIMKPLLQSIMEARQNEIPMRVLIEASSSQELEPVRRYIFMAYEQPISLNKENKKKAILDFGDKVYLECLKEHLAH